MGITITRKVPIVLTDDETETLCRILTDYARSNWDYARKTTRPALREYAETRANQARDLEAAIVRRMYETVTPAPSTPDPQPPIDLFPDPRD